MITFTGVHVTQDFGAPTVQDIAVQAMRIPRFCGSTRVWWPVGMHLLTVADLVPLELEHHALLHDAAEVCVADVPRPMKTAEAKALETRVLARIYQSLGLILPTDAESKEIHKADIRAVNAEGCFLGVRGFSHIQPGIDHLDMEARGIVNSYTSEFSIEEAIKADGRYPVLLERRLRKAVACVTNTLTLSNAYTNAS